MNSVKFKANINELNKLATRVTSLENSVFPEPGEAPEGAILTINDEGLPEYVPADDVSVGHAKLADNLDSNVSTEDKVPYIFRTAGGSADIGEREFDTIVGGSVVWNQLADNSLPPTSRKEVTITGNDDGTFSMDGTTSSQESASGWFKLATIYPEFMKLNGHKVYASFKLISGSVTASDFKFYISNGSYSIALGNDKVYSIATTMQNCRLVWSDDAVFANAKMRIQVIDLTQMFGSAIADYIYTLETATTGAGVAWFKKLFPKDYYPYDAGTLKHVEGLTAHKMVGFNQWDEEWELGIISSSNGGNVDDSSHIRSKNFCRCLPNTAYYVQIPSPEQVRIYWYDADKNFISAPAGTYATTYTTPSNCYYFKIVTWLASYGTTYKHDICVNLHWDGERDGEYEQYKEMSYPLDDSLILRGVPKLDANNALYYDGDMYESDGKVTRRYGLVDLGSLTYEKKTDAVGEYFQTTKPNDMALVVSGVIPDVICERYIPSLSSNVQNGNIAFGVGSGTAMYIRDTSFDSAEAIKTGLDGVKLVYPLATPTTEEAAPYEAEQWVDNFGTEEYETTGIPVGHDTRYPVNLKAKLEMLPNSPDGDGDYIMRQSNGMNAFIPYAEVKELPDMPTENGTYLLQDVKTASGVTLSWVSDT